MSEKVFFKDESVFITNTRAVLEDKTYAMANITSVSWESIPPALGDYATFGMFLILAGFISALLALSTLSYSFNLFTVLLVIIGVAVGFVGLRINKLPKPTYVVKIGSASGESDVLYAKDKDYINRIVNAINAAIIERG